MSSQTPQWRDAFNLRFRYLLSSRRRQIQKFPRETQRGLARNVASPGTSPIRKVFREAFEAAGLPYFQPHSLRNTLVALGQKCCRTAEQLKAWSQNLGHEDVMTTLSSYGEVSTQRQGMLISEFGRPSARIEDDERLAQQVIELIRQRTGA
jgi:integrase